jgi:2-polyprenyl-6-hydroxyphenyl methylase/3-demethylubiquinone-9 3-methyltransferase
MENTHFDYGYLNACRSHEYIWEPLQELLSPNFPEPSKLFEIGCGNGNTANMLTELGWRVTGVDPSESGIKIANESYKNISLHSGSAYDDLSAKYGKFPVVLSIEVIEHTYNPRKFAQSMFELLEDKGIAIITTPYHGYLKNLALAITGKMDKHFTALWDGGHIKFWSEKTLRILLHETGFKNIKFIRAGRIPPFAKSMIALAHKP